MSGPLNPHPEQRLKPLDCGECEALFADVLDQADGIAALEATDITRFNAHVADCAACSGLLAEARRGHDWLRMLQQDTINPPADLLGRILAKTTGAAPGVTIPATDSALAGQPSINAATQTTSPAISGSKPWQRINLVAMAQNARRTVSEPRFLLTAAMAFFSITLTFNLLGVRVTQVRPGDLKPSNMRRAISRTYTDTTARVTRYYDNLRIVYELEARVREFRRNADAEPESTPKQQDAKPAGNGGPSSQRDTNNNNTNTHVAGQGKDGQSESPKIDEPEPATIRDSTLREVALRHPQARRSNSYENFQLQAMSQRRLV